MPPRRRPPQLHPESPDQIRRTITVTLPDELAQQLHVHYLRSLQAMEGMTFADVVRELLQIALASLPEESAVHFARQNAYRVAMRQIRHRVAFALREIQRDLEFDYEAIGKSRLNGQEGEDEVQGRSL